MARPARRSQPKGWASVAAGPGEAARPRRVTVAPAVNDNVSSLRKTLWLALAGLALAAIVVGLLAG